MPFRYLDVSSSALDLPKDPFGRFVEIYTAFEDSRRFYEDRAPIRFAAATLVTTPGQAQALVDAIRMQEKRIGEQMGFFTAVAAPLRLILAAILHKRGDTPEAFCADFEGARKLFRQHNLRRNEVFELLTYTILRGQADNKTIASAQVERVAEIYRALRSYHYFLTGPEDLPACAALAGTHESAKDLGNGTEELYQSLREQAGWWPGEQLQTASHIMYLSGVEPTTITARAIELGVAFRARKYKIRAGDYDNVALLSMLALPIERIADTVTESAERIQKELKMWFGRNAAFNLAVSISFVQLLQGNDQFEHIVEIKTLLDMQAIIAAQQSAAGAA